MCMCTHAKLNDPWSGFYQLGASFFTQAHWTQFTEPGWRFLGGGVAQERGDVVFAALAPEDGSELTLVAVNAGDSAATLPLTLAAGANMNMLRVWGGGRYQTDHFYDMADEMGLMLWQEGRMAVARRLHAWPTY